MIPAKIINLNPVQVEYYGLPKPNSEEFYDICDYWNNAYAKYSASKVIADVENVEDERYIILRWIDVENKEIQIETCRLDINQSCFIEPTEEGKCKIVKI